jgi:uncharacterized protein (TIGR02266 family)
MSNPSSGNPSGPKGAELRKAERIDSSIDVDYSTYSSYHIKRITNISKGGVFIRTQDIFPVGTVMEIRFRLPKLDHQIQSKVKVMWTYRQPASVNLNSSGMGVGFLEISDADKNAIQSFIDQIVRESEEE